MAPRGKGGAVGRGPISPSPRRRGGDPGGAANKRAEVGKGVSGPAPLQPPCSRPTSHVRPIPTRLTSTEMCPPSAFRFGSDEEREVSMRSARTLFSIVPALVLLGGGLLPPARAEAPEGCPGLIASRPSLVAPVALPQDAVGLTFVGHATFLIESPKGVRIATDYSDGSRPPVTPEVATMNKAHATHFSIRPDPAIQHVLKGWNPAGGPAHHDLTVRDVRIRNVSTNIRTYGSATEYDGNSIFVFETARLCIAHLGPPAPHAVAGAPQETRSDRCAPGARGRRRCWRPSTSSRSCVRSMRLMVPMHFFGSSTPQPLPCFARAHFPVEFGSTASITLSRETLPTSPKILVLQGH